VAPPSFRLDTLAAALVGRLEASRGAWQGNDEAARAEIARIVEEGATAMARECRDTYGDNQQAHRLQEEALRTFLPRYTRLALEQNLRESRPFRFMAGQIAPRLLGVLLAFVVPLVIERRFPIVWPLLIVMPLVALFWPEIHTFWSRRGYRDELQSLVDDMGRVQDAVELLPAPEDPR